MKSTPRSLAVGFLTDLFNDHRHLDSLSQNTEFLDFDSRDRRFVTELVYGVLRNLKLLDHYLESLSHTTLKELDATVLWILRVALYQIEFLRTPNHAVVNEAVETCRRFRKASAHSFVNAILRGFLRERIPLPKGESSSDLAVRFSHPEWLVKRFLNRYGIKQTIALLKRNNQPPSSVHWVNVFMTDLPSLCKELEEDQITYEVHSYLPNCISIQSSGFVEHPAYQEGRCFRMDAASQEVAYLENLTNRKVLGDFCCAPGGKSFLIASQMEDGAKLFCCEVNFSRLLETDNRAQFLNVPNLNLINADLSVHPPFKEIFDFVLLDVPCSGIGTLRSNPDIRWKILEKDLNRFHDLQVSILQNGFSSIRPGGQLTYSTCSTEPEENECVIEEFLAHEKRALAIGEFHRTFPEPHLGDCFFAARIRHI
ncbi:MAG: transcription antitermination factor NusB [Acidobacteriota bacterium]|nr:transcription antitermination factor NusB [Acidobacteriota bacterium]